MSRFELPYEGRYAVVAAIGRKKRVDGLFRYDFPRYDFSPNFVDSGTEFEITVQPKKP